MLRHILVVSAGELPRRPLEKVLDRFSRDIRGCPGLISINWGENGNPTGLERGYSYVCTADVDDIDTLKAEYWHHPAHQILLAELPGVCAARFALDYDVEERSIHDI